MIKKKKIQNQVLVIDPGLAGSGFALFDADDFFNPREVVTPVKTWVKTLKTDEAYFEHLIKEVVSNTCLVKVYCEGQALMGGKKGSVTASSGALVKLSNFAGALRGMFWHAGIEFEYVPVAKWKGQLDKAVVIHRILKVWPECSCTTHDFDAVGIGFYLQSLINK